MEIRLFQKVDLRDNNNYAIKDIGKTFIELELGQNVHLRNILYVPCLKKILVFISCLEDKWDRVEFFDGKFIVWSKCSSIYSTNVIGIHEKRLYTLETTYSSICT